MDVHTSEQRSFNMSQIKCENTKPELIIRHLLWKNGYRYNLHRKDLPGNPDIVFPGKKKAIFVHGCFWHQHNCRYSKWPKTNSTFWKHKINGNEKRDKDNYRDLKLAGWRYLVIWECETKEKDLSGMYKKLMGFLKR